MTLRGLTQKLSGLVKPRDANKRDQRLIAASGLFDESYYLMNGADVAVAGAEPIEQFCAHGCKRVAGPISISIRPGIAAATLAPSGQTIIL